MSIVVVGSGMAATRLVEELVARGRSDVVLLGDERHPPYNRILLSSVLEGTHRPEAIRPDTVFVPFHWVGANKLTNDVLDPASRMPEFKVCAAALESL